MILSVCSLFVGVLDIRPSDLFTGSVETWDIFLISRLPRLLAILCTGIGMSVAGLIMQQLCMNKFVSPTTGATISSAQFGILLALLFAPGSTLWGRAAFSFVCAVLGTWVFVWFIQRIQFKDVVMVPLVGIMFSNIVMGVTNSWRFCQIHPERFRPGGGFCPKRTADRQRRLACGYDEVSLSRHLRRIRLPGAVPLLLRQR